MWGSAGPTQSQTNQAMGYFRRKSKQGKLSEDVLFLEKSLDFLSLSLYPLLHPLEIPVPSKNQYPWKFHINFLSPLEIPLLFHLNPVISTCSFFIQYPSKFHVLNPPCCLDFFWNGPITELCVVVIQSEILLRYVYLARYFKTGISMSVQSEHIVIL